MARDEAQLLAMGERIRELRESNGLKQQTVADHCEVTLRTYQFWQEGKHPPSQDALDKLAELFKVTPQYILRGATPTLSGNHDIGERLGRIEAKIDQLVDNAARQPDGQLTAQQLAEMDQTRAHLEQLVERMEAQLRQQNGAREAPRPSRAARSSRASDKPAA